MVALGPQTQKDSRQEAVNGRALGINCTCLPDVALNVDAQLCRMRKTPGRCYHARELRFQLLSFQRATRVCQRSKKESLDNESTVRKASSGVDPEPTSDQGQLNKNLRPNLMNHILPRIIMICMRTGSRRMFAMARSGDLHKSVHHHVIHMTSETRTLDPIWVQISNR